MLPPTFSIRALLITGLLCTFALNARADGPQIVFRNGNSVPLSSLTLQGNNLVISSAAEGYVEGQSFPMELADHVYGDRPLAVSQGIALLASGKADEAIKLLEPVVASQRISAKIPGNFWVEAARVNLMAYSIEGKATKAEVLGKEITDATPALGMDPYVLLGKALAIPVSTKVEERILALKDLATDDQLSSVCAYSTFFRGKLLKDASRNPEALEAFLTVTGIYPTGSNILNAADILSGLTRRTEAIALVNSAALNAPGTVLADESKRRLDSLK
jgi:tetratricopeptide (TPR) repeat protein